MANDLNLNDPRLRDPIGQIPDGLKDPVQDKTPGFFQSIRNPVDLMLEESLPASLYQWMTGNTKKKQAQEALEFIRNNPNLAGTPIYQEAERKLQRFGYLLEEGPMSIDMKEVGNMIKKNPKLFGAELVNMLMADPWLMFMPLGWHKLGRGVVNAIRLKSAKNLQLTKVKADKLQAMSDIKVGATATLATPLVFSSVWQLSEDAKLDPKRTTVETTIGATAGALISVGFAGTGALIQKATNMNKQRIINIQNKTYQKYQNNPEKMIEYKDGIYRSIDDIVEDLKVNAKDAASPETFDALKADMTSALRTLNENAKDMAIANSLKVAGSLAAIGGVAQFLTADDDKVLATAKGAAAGLAVYGAGKLLIKRLRSTTKEMDLAAENVEAGLDAMKLNSVKLNSSGHELANAVKLMVPDAIDSQPILFHYLTRAKVDPKTLRPPEIYNPKFKPITLEQLKSIDPKLPEAAKAIEKIFNDFGSIFGEKGLGLFNSKRANYLPLLWTHYNPAEQPFKFVKDFDKAVTGVSPTFQFGKRGMFGDINRGLQKGYKIKPEYENPVELIKIYVNAASKALASRALISNLERSNIGGKPLLLRNIKTTPIGQDYVKFDHPYFENKFGMPYIHKGMEKSLRMVFDATNEQALMGALFTTNLMMKRLAVGFSFFHAGALVESMIFAGTKLRTIGKVINPYSKKELQSFIDNPTKYKTQLPSTLPDEFIGPRPPNAIEFLEQNGYKDVIQFARGSGVQISTPEDIGFDRFYYNFSGLQRTSIDKFWKRHFGVSPAEKIEKVFKWFDRITWDRVFTHAKLNTFLTALNKTVQPGDTHAILIRKAQRAAQFSNDAFGGQDWAKLANSIQTPWLKSMMQTTFRPGSRGYMQLLMFAPDWTLSNLRIIAKSLPAFEKDPNLRRLYQYYFLRAAVIYAAAGSALNYAFSGKSLLENTDPTRIDLGNGEVLTFSKQLMEPFHWITAPQSTGLKKIGALPRVTIEVLTNKKYLTTKWSPNITKKDDEAIEKGLKIGGQIGKRFLPIWLQTASQNISEGLQRDGLSADLAWDTAVDFVLGQSGHPRYQGPRYTQYKTKGLVRSPYETLF